MPCDAGVGAGAVQTGTASGVYLFVFAAMHPLSSLLAINGKTGHIQLYQPSGLPKTEPIRVGEHGRRVDGPMSMEAVSYTSHDGFQVTQCYLHLTFYCVTHAPLVENGTVPRLGQ